MSRSQTDAAMEVAEFLKNRPLEIPFAIGYLAGSPDVLADLSRELQQRAEAVGESILWGKPPWGADWEPIKITAGTEVHCRRELRSRQKRRWTELEVR